MKYVNKYTIAILGLLVIVGLGTLYFFSDDDAESSVAYTDFTTSNYYDTTIAMRMFHEEGEDLEDLTNELHEILEKTHRLSTWFVAYEGLVNVKTINDNPGEYHTVDPLLFDMLELSIEYYDITDGYFDITLGPVIDVWDEHRERCLGWQESLRGEENSHEIYEQEKDQYCTIPEQSTLDAANAYVGIEGLHLDKDNYQVMIEAGMRLDLGGMAKGYGAKMLGEVLKDDERIEAFILNAGTSNVEVYGDHPYRDNDLFYIGITNPENPFGLENTYATIKMESGKNATTSGDYDRYYEVDGRKYHHLINPYTLYPTDHHKAVTMVSEDGAFGDILVTAVFIMPLEEGLDYVNARDDLEAIWFEDSCVAPVMSEAFEAQYLRHFTLDFDCDEGRDVFMTVVLLAILTLFASSTGLYYFLYGRKKR